MSTIDVPSGGAAPLLPPHERRLAELTGHVQALEATLLRTMELDAMETRAAVALAEVVSELQGDVAELGRQIRTLFEGSTPASRTKAAQDVMSCVECGGTYEAEPGPPLCGGCWVRLGRPSLYSIPTNGGQDDAC